MPSHAPSDFELAHRIRLRGIARQSEPLPDDPIRNSRWCRALTLVLAVSAMLIGLFGLLVTALCHNQLIDNHLTRQHEVLAHTPSGYRNPLSPIGDYDPIYPVKSILTVPSDFAILVNAFGAFLGLAAFFLRIPKDSAKLVCAFVGVLCCVASVIVPFIYVLLAEITPS